MSSQDAVAEVQRYVNSIRRAPALCPRPAKRFHSFVHAESGTRMRVNLKTGKVVALA